MANAVEDALNRASPETQARNWEIIAEARRRLELVSMNGQEVGTPRTPTDAEVFEEARRNIPVATMQDVDHVSSPLATPTSLPAKSNVVDLHADTRANIENIEQGGGNNYLRENAMDRAMNRQPQELQREEPQREMER